MEKNFLEKVLACPNCKGSVTINVEERDDLGIKSGIVICKRCKREFPISDGIFYLRMLTKVTDNRGEAWSLNEFEARYDTLPVYKSAVEWGNLTGIPVEVTNFMYPKIKGRILDWLMPKQGDLILDVGCGVGYFLFEILQKNYGMDLHMIGIDVAMPNIKSLRKRCKEEKVKNIICIVADCQNLPIMDNTVDINICSEVLEHVPSPAMAINEMARVLEKGGTLFASTPLDESNKKWRLLSSPFRLAKNIIFFNKKIKPHNKSFDVPITSNELKQFMEEKLFILTFEKNVILPPEGYFKKLPRAATMMVVSICGFIESHFKRAFQSLAMHAVIKAKKI